MWLAADAAAQRRAARSGAADRAGSGTDGGGHPAQQRRADKGKAPAAVVDTDMQTGGAARGMQLPLDMKDRKAEQIPTCSNAEKQLLGADKGKCAD